MLPDVQLETFLSFGKKAPIRLMSQGKAMSLAGICLRLHLEASHCQRTCETLAEFLAHHVHRASLEFGNVVFITATTSDFNPRFVSKWHLKMDPIFALTHLARTTSAKSHVALECGGLLHVQMPCVFMPCAFLMPCVFQSLSILTLMPCVSLDFSYPNKRWLMILTKTRTTKTFPLITCVFPLLLMGHQHESSNKTYKLFNHHVSFGTKNICPPSATMSIQFLESKHLDSPVTV